MSFQWLDGDGQVYTVSQNTATKLGTASSTGLQYLQMANISAMRSMLNVGRLVIEKDLGSSSLQSGSFDTSGFTNLGGDNTPAAVQASGPYTGKGTLEDEAAMDILSCTAFALDLTTIRVFWQSLYPVRGNFKFIISGV